MFIRVVHDVMGAQRLGVLHCSGDCTLGISSSGRDVRICFYRRNQHKDFVVVNARRSVPLPQEPATLCRLYKGRAFFRASRTVCCPICYDSGLV